MAGEREPLVLRGRPEKLGGFVRIPEPVSGVFPLAFADGERAAGPPVSLRIAGEGRLARADVRMPKGTPPGRYRCSADIGGRDTPFVLEVEPRRRIRVLPRRLRLEVEPGAEASFALTIVNVGNVDVVLPATAVVGLFASRGADTAIGRTFRAGGGEKRGWDRLFEELERAYGGTLGVRLEQGGRKLPPAEAVDVRGSLRVPDRLQPGETYWGIWELLERNVKLTLDVAAAENRPPR